MLQIVVLLLDPISLILNGIVVSFGRSRWIIPIAAFITALIGETAVTEVNFSHSWGEGFALRLIACLIQAGLIYWIVNRFRRKKPEPTVTSDSEVLNTDARAQPLVTPQDSQEHRLLRTYADFMATSLLWLHSRPELIAADDSKLLYGYFSYGFFSGLYDALGLHSGTELDRERRDAIFCECLPFDRIGITNEWASSFYDLLRENEEHDRFNRFIAKGREVAADFISALPNQKSALTFRLKELLVTHLKDRLAVST